MCVACLLRMRTPLLFLALSVLVSAAGCTDGSSHTIAPAPDAASEGPAPAVDAAVPPPPDAAPLPGGVYRVAGLEDDLPADDLAPFAAMVGNARVVALGESVHTSGGFSQAKFRLIRYLVETLGFRTFAIESPRTDAERTAAYVASCEGTPVDALAGLFGVWGNTSTRDMLAWMCAWNAAHPADPIRFFGFDVQQPSQDYAAITAFLQRVASAEATRLLGGLMPCALDPSLQSLPQERLAGCLAGLDAISSYLQEHEAAVLATASAAELRWARIALLGIRSWQDEAFFGQTDIKRGYASRDAAMAEVFLTTRELLYPNERIILWAHNWHIDRATDKAQSDLAGVRSMGTLLVASLGDAYQPFGLTAFQTEINWPGVGCGAAGAPPTERSIELLLHGLGAPYLLVDLQYAGAVPPLVVPGQRYELGIHDDRGPADVLVPGQSFRGLLFLEHSPKMMPVLYPDCAFCIQHPARCKRVTGQRRIDPSRG